MRIVLSPEDVEWVVNDTGELGVKIGSNIFFLYKGESLRYSQPTHEDGTPRMYRRVEKWEFGESCLALGVKDEDSRYTEGSGWRRFTSRDPKKRNN